VDGRLTGVVQKKIKDLATKYGLIAHGKKRGVKKQNGGGGNTLKQEAIDGKN